MSLENDFRVHDFEVNLKVRRRECPAFIIPLLQAIFYGE